MLSKALITEKWKVKVVSALQWLASPFKNSREFKQTILLSERRMYTYEDAVVLIPVDMGSSWTIKKSQIHLPTTYCSFPIVDPPQTPPTHLHPSAYKRTREPVGPVLFPLLISSQPISSKCSTRESSLLWTCSRNGLGPATPCRTISRRSNLRYSRTSIMKRLIWFTTGCDKQSNKYVSWHQKVPRLWTRYKNNHDHKQNHPHDHISTTMKKIINSIIATITKPLQGGRRTSSLRHGSLWLNWGVENVSRVL